MPTAWFADFILEEKGKEEGRRKLWYLEKVKRNPCSLFKAGLARFC